MHDASLASETLPRRCQQVVNECPAAVGILTQWQGDTQASCNMNLCIPGCHCSANFLYCFFIAEASAVLSTSSTSYKHLIVTKLENSHRCSSVDSLLLFGDTVRADCVAPRTSLQAHWADSVHGCVDPDSRGPGKAQECLHLQWGSSSSVAGLQTKSVKLSHVC